MASEYRFQQFLDPETLTRKTDALKIDLGRHDREFVLVVCRRWAPLGSDIPAPGMPHILEEKLRLGITKTPFLQLGDQIGLTPDFVISSDEHVITSERIGRTSPKLVQEPITDPSISIAQLDLPVGEKQGSKSHPPEEGEEEKPALEIVVGDVAVTDWFLNEAQYANMPAYTKRWLNEPENFDNGQVVRNRYLNLDFLILQQRMKALLGREGTADLPNGIQQRIAMEIQNRKLSILVELETTTYDAVRRAAVSKAIGLGMHKTPWTITKELIPGKTVIIDVPVLIQGYITRLDLPIPD